MGRLDGAGVKSRLQLCNVLFLKKQTNLKKPNQNEKEGPEISRVKC